MKLSGLIVVFVLLPVISRTQVPPFKEECVRGTYPPKGRTPVPNYVINLDNPPQERWAEVMKDKGPQVANLLDTFKSFLLAFSNSSQLVIDLIDSDLGMVADSMPYPFGDEMKGIANQTGLPLGEIVLYNIFYELFTVCTSIVGEDPSGKLFHARNLDFGLFLGWDYKKHEWLVTKALRPMIVTLDFQKGGQTVYKTVNFAGYIGVLTGIKPNVFTLTMNERFNIDGGYIGILKWIFGDKKSQWMSFLTRHTLEYATSYTQAKDKLSNTPMLAPAYYILGGNKSGEACIITRDRTKAADVWDMGTRNSSWYLLETNYDNWKAPLFLDDRRTPAHKCMNTLSQKNVGFPGLYDVLSSKPVLNKLTTYTALMEVSTGKMECYLQYCSEPCFPW